MFRHTLCHLQVSLLKNHYIHVAVIIYREGSHRCHSLNYCKANCLNSIHKIRMRYIKCSEVEDYYTIKLLRDGFCITEMDSVYCAVGR
jgi:hypothetical protein